MIGSFPIGSFPIGAGASLGGGGNTPANAKIAIQNLSVMAYMTSDGLGSTKLDAQGANPSASTTTVNVGPDVNWGVWPQIRPETVNDIITTTDPSSGARNYGRRIRSGGDGWMPSRNPLAGGPPQIDSIQPPTGSTSATRPVTIDGHNFAAATAVTFDGTPGTIVSVTPMEIVVYPPATAASTVTVAVVTPHGTGSLVGAYTFDTVPRIDTVSPSTFSVNAALSPVTVTITGTDLGNMSAGVLFGTVAGTVTANTGTTLSVTAPSNNAGSFTISVTTGQGVGFGPATISYGLFAEYPIPLPFPYTGAYYFATMPPATVAPGESAVITVVREFTIGVPYDSAQVSMERDPTENPDINITPGDPLQVLSLVESLNSFGLGLGLFKEES